MSRPKHWSLHRLHAPRNVRTFQTSLGFYELAIAAPSMRVALEVSVQARRGDWFNLIETDDLLYLLSAAKHIFGEN